ncbi:ribosome-associated translation inhibitor RaiA [Cyclobacterium sp. 1_MG-2023]|uniref:ribosome hibernation-promoting factor, HPF/YfiA family n=1 Tax=Cyclobacterium sp. 1_MG-2023 TaxID=3062681 RepID=UPI0026E3944A|nr:ribosome-associated translation inhibitor RaiA [Cyclobacterium sp. 1_MG-2023]MDO6438604.1 ribosome-associated translation inhibitor RaiA [Cyclobacterium sp. 1_MG-2023]|eukprot:TRINITY_DN48971_c0_g1_i1.p1 TRINITY_DN48971_c0_g1~~TRINITY_DN48971_c0_g1_i1.p1  ORF type:complete len:102 (+),score=4.95 TRINITY_DN48971_c0_g1_i1:276-581(+)
MKLQMHSIRFVADQKLIDFIQRKADKLDTYFDQIIDGEVFMRLDKNDKSENKIVEIKLNVPGKQFFAKSQNDSFEAAADDSIEALRRQIKKHKEKLVLAKQ